MSVATTGGHTKLFKCRVLIFATGLTAQYPHPSVDPSQDNKIVANLDDVAEHYTDYDDDPTTFIVRTQQCGL